MFVCNYNRKTFVVDHIQKYIEIAKDCLWIEHGRYYTVEDASGIFTKLPPIYDSKLTIVSYIRYW